MKRNTNDYRRRFDDHSSEHLPFLAKGATELGLTLTPQQLDRYAQYMDLLVFWSERINLTSIVDPEAIQVRHFLDSLTCVLAEPALSSPSGCRVIDVGAGAGFPGVPLKLAFSDLDMCLVESRGKRTEFLRACIDQLALEGT